MQPNGAGILFLQGNKFQLYSSLSTDILEFSFPDTLVRQNRVLQKEALKESISQFILTHGIQPTNLVIVLSNTTAHITNTDTTDAYTFPSPVVIKIDTPEGPRQFATNQDLFLTVKEAFEKHGFSAMHVLPGIAFSNTLGRAEQLTPQQVSLIFKETFLLEKYNLLSISLPMNTLPETADTQHSKHDLFRLYALANVVGVATIIFLVIWNRTHPEPQTQRGNADEQIISITPSPTTQHASPSAALKITP